MESLHEALQLGCLWVARGLNPGVAHGVNRSLAWRTLSLSLSLSL